MQDKNRNTDSAESTGNIDEGVKMKKIIKALALTLVFVGIAAGITKIINIALPNNSEGDSVAPVEYTVLVTENGFQPSTIQIPKNTSIEWMNDDTVSHKIEQNPNTDSNEILDSLDKTEPLNPAEVLVTTYSETGSYVYHYTVNDAIYEATIIVN